MFGLTKYFLYAAIVGGIALGIYSTFNSFQESGRKIAELEATVKRQEGRLNGAYLRIQRRDDAVDALPAQCRTKALYYIKTGDIPKKWDGIINDTSGAR